MSDPESSIYDIVSAELYEKAGRRQDAIALLEKSAASRPSDKGLTIALARLYNLSGDFSKAEGALSAQLRADPKSIAVGPAMARQYFATGRAKDAKKLFADVLTRRPNDIGALLGLAEIAGTERNWQEATDYLNRAHAAWPNDPAPGLALVSLALLRRDPKNALAAATQIAERFPTNTDVLDAKARAQTASGDTEGAIATYKRIYELSPNSTSALADYVARLNGAKDFSEARAVLQDALARDPKNGTVKADLIRLEAEIGGMRAGLAKARVFAKEDPGNPLYDILSAELFEKAGRRNEAVDCSKRPSSPGHPPTPLLKRCPVCMSGQAIPVKPRRSLTPACRPTRRILQSVQSWPRFTPTKRNTTRPSPNTHALLPNVRPTRRR